jgi:hypothetical protein
LELGADATCQNQRCEISRGNDVSGGSRGSGNQGGSGGASLSEGGAGGQIPNVGGSANGGLEVPTLCDGSEEIRVAYFSGGGFVGIEYAWTASYGLGFFAIDGQCRFWQSKDKGWVYSGTLSNQEAQEFARALGFGHLSEYSLLPEDQCPDGGVRALWTPEARIRCVCICDGGLRAAFDVAFEAHENLFASGQIVSGPAQLALRPMDGLPPAAVRGWPLQRAPQPGEIIAIGLSLDERSGALITDAAELSDLRALRADYSDRFPDARSVPVLWTNPDSQVAEGFDMLLRDEVPATVKGALEAARAAPEP